MGGRRREGGGGTEEVRERDGWMGGNRYRIAGNFGRCKFSYKWP